MGNANEEGGYNRVVAGRGGRPKFTLKEVYGTYSKRNPHLDPSYNRAVAFGYSSLETDFTQVMNPEPDIAIFFIKSGESLTGLGTSVLRYDHFDQSLALIAWLELDQYIQAPF